MPPHVFYDWPDDDPGGPAHWLTLRAIAIFTVFVLVVVGVSIFAPGLGVLLAVLLTPAVGRWSILLLTAALPYARKTASVVSEMSKGALVWGTVITATAVAASRLWCAGAAAGAAIVVSACFGLYCRYRIGGITGDTLGANVQLCECAALVAFLWTGGR